MIKPVACSCGNKRPEIVQAPDGSIVIRCHCGQAVRGITYHDAEKTWADQIRAWLDIRSEIEQRTGGD